MSGGAPTETSRAKRSRRRHASKPSGWVPSGRSSPSRPPRAAMWSRNSSRSSCMRHCANSCISTVAGSSVGEPVGPTTPVAPEAFAHCAKPCVVDRGRRLAEVVVEGGAPTGGAARRPARAARRAAVRTLRGSRSRVGVARDGSSRALAVAEVEFVPEEAADGRVGAGDIRERGQQRQRQHRVATVRVHPIEELAQRGEIADVATPRRRERVRRRVDAESRGRRRPPRRATVR